ncbi:MAG TPA: DUF4159 domain-containing protein [Gemmatimonadaceae bacterium]|jgi:hypothetical protein|nr:DUF4159 domain-containing protein [Gemmatimonadaceae bacterium]
MRQSIQYVLLAVGIAASAITASAQDDADVHDIAANPSYDGRFVFARLRYASRPGDPCSCDVGGNGGWAGWQHDYPDGEHNLLRIAADLTSLDPRGDSSAVVSADDPEIMKYPILYLSEPACWDPSEAEVKGLRKYLLKGGLLIVDDFAICNGGPVRFATSRRVFEEQIRRVLPEGKIVPVSMKNPMLNEFFQMDSVQLEQELMRNADGTPEIHGIYAHNDPKKRLMVIANYNTVLHRSWVWEAQGLSSVSGSTESYKLGVNYLMYGFTH